MVGEIMCKYHYVSSKFKYINGQSLAIINICLIYLMAFTN